MMDEFISSWIRQAAEEMSSSVETGAVSLAPLKRFQRKIERTLDLDLDKDNQFVVFFLSTLIQDLFYNFSGDFPYSGPVEEEKQKVFRELVTDFRRFAEALELEGSGEKLQACSELVNTYLTGVSAVNAILTKEELHATG
jgi:hypothetical protein